MKYLQNLVNISRTNVDIFVQEVMLKATEFQQKLKQISVTKENVYA